MYIVKDSVHAKRHKFMTLEQVYSDILIQVTLFKINIFSKVIERKSVIA